MAKKKIECPECKREPLAQEPKLKGVIDVLRADVDALKNDVRMIGTAWRRDDGRPLGEPADLQFRPDLVDLYQIFVQHPRARHIINAPFAMRLYSLIRATGAKVVIDIGTGIGCSAAFAAKAVLDNGGGRVLTYDPRAEFVAVSRKTVPPVLAKAITWGIYADDMIESIPWGDADLVIIDAPIALPAIAPHTKEGTHVIIDRRVGGYQSAPGKTEEGVLHWMGALPHWQWAAEWGLSRFTEYTERRWPSKQRPDGSIVVSETGNVQLVVVRACGWPITIACVRHKAK